VITKIEAHRRFWQGDGPCLILVPAARNTLYDLEGYPDRFHDPEAMWRSEMSRARPVIDWPTDGIPTVRPNLGVVFVPAIAGLDFRLPEAAMPWPGAPLPLDRIRAARDIVPEQTEVFGLARDFYDVHRRSGATDVAPYLADTQGVFDIAHLLRGDEIFFDLADPEAGDRATELMDVCSVLYERASLALKRALGEDNDTMIHGHGAEQGLHFPHAGARVAEDTATLLSPSMIESVILPAVTRCADRFGGIFAHFCGHHPTLLRQLAELPGVKAIDLGNPEQYDSRRVMECCAETDTVLYSRLAAEPGEDWRAYATRLAGLVQTTGARVALRPVLFPASREDCRELLDMWHALTTQ
jgi:hypothetical protein